MSDFNSASNSDYNHGLLAAREDANLNSLLNDKVVMQWLMDLEAQDMASDMQDSDADFAMSRMRA